MIMMVRFAHRLISVVLLLIVAVVAVISALSALGELRVHNEIGASMTPAIRRGDLVLYRQAMAGSLAAGDIIGLRWPGSDIPITHRIVRASHAGGVITLATKGDGSRSTDKVQITFPAHTPIWRVTAVVPRLGPLVAGVTNSGVPLVAGLVPLFLGLPWIEKQLRVRAQKAPLPMAMAMAMGKVQPDLPGGRPEGRSKASSDEASVAVPKQGLQ